MTKIKLRGPLASFEKMIKFSMIVIVIATLISSIRFSNKNLKILQAKSLHQFGLDSTPVLDHNSIFARNYLRNSNY